MAIFVEAAISSQSRSIDTRSWFCDCNKSKFIDPRLRDVATDDGAAFYSEQQLVGIGLRLNSVTSRKGILRPSTCYQLSVVNVSSEFLRIFLTLKFLCFQVRLIA